MIVKVKEPQAAEVARLRAAPHALHLPAPRARPRADARARRLRRDLHRLRDRRGRAGRLPLLAPMSEVAGKIATQAGAFMLEKPLGGRGLLLGGVPGVAAGKVMVIGGGVVGMNAAIIALGMEAEVYVFDRNIDRLRELESCSTARARPCYASTLAIEEHLPEADLVIGAVLVHGAKAPHVVTREQLGLMKQQRGARRRLDRPGRLLRDLAADDALRPDLRGRRRSRTTAWPTCPARCRSRRPTRSPTRRCPTSSTSPTAACRRALGDEPGLHARAQRRRRARSPTSRSPRPRPASTRRRSTRCGAVAAWPPEPARYHLAPHADDHPARPQGPQGPEARSSPPRA